MPAITHQHNNQRKQRQGREFAFEQMMSAIKSIYGPIDPHTEGTLKQITHQATLQEYGLVGKTIAELFLFILELLINPAYRQAVQMYLDAMHGEKYDEYQSHELVYVPRTPASKEEWREVLGNLDGQAGAAYVVTGDNRGFYVDMKTFELKAELPLPTIRELKNQLGLTAQVVNPLMNHELRQVSSEQQTIQQLIEVKKASIHRVSAPAVLTQQQLTDNARIEGELNSLRNDLEAISQRNAQKNVAVTVRTLDAQDLEKITNTTGHQRRKFSRAYCKQNVHGEFDPNGKFPPIYQLGADNKPDYSRLASDAEAFANPTLVRANGFEPFPNRIEGLKTALDWHTIRMLGPNALGMDGLLRTHGVTSLQQDKSESGHDLASDNAFRQMQMQRASRPGGR